MYIKKLYPIDYYPLPTDTAINANTFDDLLSGNFKNRLNLNVKPYKGMIVCVNNVSKIYSLNEEDITKPQNWTHIGNCYSLNEEDITKPLCRMYIDW